MWKAGLVHLFLAIGAAALEFAVVARIAMTIGFLLLLGAMAFRWLGLLADRRFRL